MSSDDDDDVLMMLIYGDGRSVYRCGESAAGLSCLFTVSVVPVVGECQFQLQVQSCREDQL